MFQMRTSWVTIVDGASVIFPVKMSAAVFKLGYQCLCLFSNCGSRRIHGFDRTPDVLVIKERASRVSVCIATDISKIP